MSVSPHDRWYKAGKVVAYPHAVGYEIEAPDVLSRQLPDAIFGEWAALCMGVSHRVDVAPEVPLVR